MQGLFCWKEPYFEEALSQKRPALLVVHYDIDTEQAHTHLNICKHLKISGKPEIALSLA